MRIVAFITDPTPVREILAHLSEPIRPPIIAPARGPPLWHMPDARRDGFDSHAQLHRSTNSLNASTGNDDPSTLVKGGSRLVVRARHSGRALDPRAVDRVTIGAISRPPPTHDSPLTQGSWPAISTLTTLLTEVGFCDIRFWRIGRIPPLAESMIALPRKA